MANEPTPSRKTEKWLLAALLFLALGIRVGAGCWWQGRIDGPFHFGDSETYWELARSLSAGAAYEYGPDQFKVFRTPGYPLMLAPLFWVFGGDPPVLVARILGAILGMLTVLVLWWWGRYLFGVTAGLIAAAVGAVYPGAIITSILVLSEAPFCPIMVLNLVLWTVAIRSKTSGRSILAATGGGVSFGCGVLVRPSWLLFLPFATVIGLIFAGSRRRQLAVAGISMAAGLVILAPWWIRNAVVTGHFIPTTLQTGASLYDGLNPKANGASEMSFVAVFLEDERSNPSSEESLEYRLNRRLASESVDWTRAHPLVAIRLAGVKFLRMWNVFPNEPSLSSFSARLGLAVSYLPVLILAVFGAVTNFRRGFSYMLCWLPAVYFSLLHMVFIGSIRYRQPAMLGLIVLAAGTVAAWTARPYRAEHADG